MLLLGSYAVPQIRLFEPGLHRGVLRAARHRRPDEDHVWSRASTSLITQGAHTAHPEASARFIDFLMQPDVVQEYSEAQIMIPASDGAEPTTTPRWRASSRSSTTAASWASPTTSSSRRSRWDRCCRSPDSTATRRARSQSSTTSGARSPPAAPGDARRRSRDHHAGAGHPARREAAGEASRHRVADTPGVLLDGPAGLRAVLRVPHRPGARGRVLQLHRLPGLRTVELRRAGQLQGPVHATTGCCHAYRFTFQFAIVATILVNIISLAIAVGLNAGSSSRPRFAAVYFVPYVLAILVIGYVFQYLFTISLPAIRSRWASRFSPSTSWPTPTLAWVAIVILAVWQAAAFNDHHLPGGPADRCPVELYEAAVPRRRVGVAAVPQRSPSR